MAEPVGGAPRATNDPRLRSPRATLVSSTRGSGRKPRPLKHGCYFASMPSSRAVNERVRPLVSSRTLATNAASMGEPVLPQALRT